MVVTKIIFLNFALFLINGLFFPDNWLTFILSIHGDYTLTDPRFCWQLLTYGFVHDPRNLMHILGNMFCLFIFGYELERRLGSREFLRFYLVTIVFGGVIWAITNVGTPVPCLGASGGVVGLVILYGMFYPHRTLLFMFVIPMPAWLLGVLIVAWDMLRELGMVENKERVACMVHIAGAAFAFMYYNYGWNFLRAEQRIKKLFTGNKKPKLRIYDADEKPRKKTEEEIDSEKVDEILKKISEKGEASLSAKERKILENATKKYQDKYRK